MTAELSKVAKAEALPIVFYDGACGLCHHTVRYLIREDPDALHFRFAPLGGETFERHLAPAIRATLPDSVVVLAPDGTLYTQTDATLQLLERLGGRHRRTARMLRAVPRPVRDFAYAVLAAVRHRIWARPDEACPVASPELRARFDP